MRYVGDCGIWQGPIILIPFDDTYDEPILALCVHVFMMMVVMCAGYTVVFLMHRSSLFFIFSLL